VAEIIHAPNSRTGGFLLEQHVVNFPETFYVLTGTFKFFCSQLGNFIATEVNTGDIVSIPAGTPYGYKNVGAEPGKLLLITNTDSFEHFIEAIGIPVTEPVAQIARSPQLSMDKVAAVAHQYGIDFLN
jgi:mannose-6-phosphate isomerase-like protein (cupin superfamily)